MTRTGGPSIQLLSLALDPRPMSGTETSAGLPLPSMSAKRMRWTVGSASMGWTVHGSSRVLPRLSHCRVPPDLGVERLPVGAEGEVDLAVAVDVVGGDADVVGLGARPR